MGEASAEDLRFCHRNIEEAARELFETPPHSSPFAGAVARCAYGESETMHVPRVFNDWVSCLGCATSFALEAIKNPEMPCESRMLGPMGAWKMLRFIADHWVELGHPAGVMLKRAADEAELRHLTSLKNP